MKHNSPLAGGARGADPPTSKESIIGAARSAAPRKKNGFRGVARMHLDPGCRPRRPFYRFPDPFYRILQISILDPTKQESDPESAGAAAVTLAEPSERSGARSAERERKGARSAER